MDFSRLIGNKQDNLNKVPNCSKYHVSYFEQIILTKMKLTKFGSLNLDTPRISYEFYKFATKSRKKHLKKNIKNPVKC